MPTGTRTVNVSWALDHGGFAEYINPTMTALKLLAWSGGKCNSCIYANGVGVIFRP